MTEPSTELIERVRTLPGMCAVLDASEGLGPLYLVGGAVRDLLRGAVAVDLDLAVEGDGPATAAELAVRLGGEAIAHERFGTARVQSGAATFDLAATRRERYERPGTLPEVEPAGLDEDLARRDFTVNAMAIELSGAEAGRLHDFNAGRRDLADASIRVLHDASFRDDPTRLLRAVRYAARLGGALELRTEELAREAAAADALRNVSGPRVRDELMDLLAEPDAPAAVALLGELGIARALHPRLLADPDLVASAGLGSAETGAQPALAGLAAMCSAAPGELTGFIEGLGLPAADRASVLRAASRAPALAEDLRAGEPKASQLYALLEPEPPEALALALALGARGDQVLRYTADLRDVTLEITGDDLVSAGVPSSPAIGRALQETLRRKLDGELSGREAELRSAVERARGEA